MPGFISWGCLFDFKDDGAIAKPLVSNDVANFKEGLWQSCSPFLLDCENRFNVAGVS